MGMRSYACLSGWGDDQGIGNTNRGIEDNFPVWDIVGIYPNGWLVGICFEKHGSATGKRIKSKREDKIS